LKIGSITLENITVFAPLAGITNLPLRLIAKQEGCGLVCSEMISAKGLVYKSEKTHQLLDSRLEEKPLSVQIFGAEPRTMAEAAKMVEDSGADILDINFGCSVPKVLKTGSGSALMKDPRLAGDILQAVRKSIRIPLTIKMRTGWDGSGDQAVTTAKIAWESGVDAITVHPRTARQGFSGQADWSIIARVKQTVPLPVIGNGDITCGDDALKMIHQTTCDGIMVGRAAFGRPWIFSEILAVIHGKKPPEVICEKRFDTMVRYAEASVAYLGEKQACFMMRSRLGWFSKGLPHSTRFRESIKKIESQRQAMEIIQEYRNLVEKDFLEKGSG
jgi:nifR3 family TIM-barrel protein